MTKQISLLCAAALLVCGQAYGQTTFYWTFNGPSNDYPTGQVPAGYSETRGNATEGFVTLTPEGWANTVNSANTFIEKQVPSTNKGLWFWGTSGLGLYNLDRGLTTGADDNEGSSPEHAIDNNGRYEMVLLAFDRAVNLSSVRIGWPTANDPTNNIDTDMTVLAYTGDPSLGPGLVGKTWNTLGAAWSLIGNYANVASRSDDTADISAQSSGIFSSFWLVGAYNDLAGGTDCFKVGDKGCVAGNDYFKLLKVAGSFRAPDEGGAPEPGTLALFGIAMVGALRASRRRKA